MQFEIENQISVRCEKEIFADIVSMTHKIVVEFNGDYWHCNPSQYKADFFHTKKKCFASEVWSADEHRIQRITELGYKVIIVWESEYNRHGWQERLQESIRELDGKQDKDIDAFRSSVNNYSSADVKLGELLGTCETNATT
jgi:G:T-mismatch repair DNA endonuclease (very short patch repair protein)